MRIFVVTPAYNEASRIGQVLQLLKTSKLPVVVVDDGSKDRTFQEASKYGFMVLRHKINLGKGAALKTGCEAAFLSGADAVVIMDADGQHKVEDLPKFIEALEQGKNDVIFGSRNLNFNVPLVRFMGNKIASVLVSMLFGIYISDLICGYRAFSKKAYEKLRLQSAGYGIETEMVIRTAKTRLKRCEVSVQTVYYDKFKGVTLLDAFKILFEVFKWRIFR